MFTGLILLYTYISVLNMFLQSIFITPDCVTAINISAKLNTTDYWPLCNFIFYILFLGISVLFVFLPFILLYLKYDPFLNFFINFNSYYFCVGGCFFLFCALPCLSAVYVYLFIKKKWSL